MADLTDLRTSLSVAASHIENARDARKRAPVNGDPVSYQMAELDLALRWIKRTMSALWAANPDNASASDAPGRAYSAGHNGYVAVPIEQPSEVAAFAGREFLLSAVTAGRQSKAGIRLTREETHRLFEILGISGRLGAFEQSDHVDVRGIGRVTVDGDGYSARLDYPAGITGQAATWANGYSLAVKDAGGESFPQG